MDSPWTLCDYEDFVLEFLQKLNIKDPITMGHSHGYEALEDSVLIVFSNLDVSAYFSDASL